MPQLGNLEVNDIDRMVAKIETMKNEVPLFQQLPQFKSLASKIQDCLRAASIETDPIRRLDLLDSASLGIDVMEKAIDFLLDLQTNQTN